MLGASRAICIPKPATALAADGPTPDAILDEWLSARGFERRDQTPCWPCDDRLERGFFLFEDERWTVVLYSGTDGVLDEDNRLLLHVTARTDGPILYVWSAGRNWGYRIHRGRDVLDAHVAPPAAAASCVEHWLTDHPVYGDLAFLRETFASPADPRLLDAIRRSRVIHPDAVAARFCEALGVAPAAFGYADIEWRFLAQDGAGTFDGFSVRRAYCVRRGFEPGRTTLKLHDLAPRVATPHQSAGWWPSLGHLLESDYHVALLRLYALIHLLLWPLGFTIQWLVRSALWADAACRWLGIDRPPRPRNRFEADLSADAPVPFRILGGGGRGSGPQLRNDLRRCTIRLPAGAKPLPDECHGAFAFTLGKTTVNAEAVRPDAEEHIRAMFRYPAGFVVAHEEASTTAGGHPARLIVWQAEPKETAGSDDGDETPPPRRHRMPPQTVFVNHWVVQTPDAFFAFSCAADREATQSHALSLLRGVVESLRVDPDSCAKGVTSDTSATTAAAPPA